MVSKGKTPRKLPEAWEPYRFDGTDGQFRDFVERADKLGYDVGSEATATAGVARALYESRSTPAEQGAMARRRTNAPEITDQGRAFIEKARELGCDEDPAAFDRMFERIVPPKRKPEGQGVRETRPGKARPGQRRKAEG